MKLIPVALCAFALSACVSGGKSPDAPAPMTPPDNANAPAQNGVFSCENGLTVQVRHLNNDQIELRLDDKQTVMDAAVSGSGSRYASNTGLFGTGAEWHSKAGSAVFAFADPYGNRVQTNCHGR